ELTPDIRATSTIDQDTLPPSLGRSACRHNRR
ncbi:MAG: hypothetical protein QOI26_2208, partial [Pseudonocardiales bacterium]|nr:hypothetical protein [Pseudonocardiales bacterium]